MPAPPPATRLVNGEAGFFWPGPFMLLADIVRVREAQNLCEAGLGLLGASDVALPNVLPLPDGSEEGCVLL